MIRAIYGTTLLVFSAGAAWSQAPAFEVATIKPAAQMMDGKVFMGAGGDQGRYTCTNYSLKDIVAQAYRMKPFQVSGPSWMERERYDITAKIPEGVSRDQVPEMLQNLLAERFRMTVRKENKELPVYALIVGKGGPKMKASDESSDAPLVFGQDGTSKARAEVMARSAAGAGAGSGKGVMVMGGAGNLQANKVTMGAFATMLSRMLDRPVLDMTGIEGKYDLALQVSMEDLIGMKKLAGGVAVMHQGEGGPAPEGSPHGSIFSAVQQLGLKLEPRKAPVDFVIVESAEKVATEN
jgi:uncharacterized protein (TIGR03435 family)